MADNDITKALDKVLQTYKAGGEYAQQRGEQLKGEERRYTAGAQQGLVSRGLSGTTVAAGIPAAFEQEVAAPYRTQTEMLRSGQEMQGLIAKAGFLESATQREFQATQQKSEQDAAMERLVKQIAANRPAGAPSKMSTFESRAADRKAELDAAERDRGGVAAGGATQHIGSGGGFDLGMFGIDRADGGFGIDGATAGGAGQDAIAGMTPAEISKLTPGYYHDEQGYPVQKSGAPLVGDQEFSTDDLMKLAEQWMNQ
jgi:hypothetical protein